jgi:hypothetical protein
MKGCAACVVLNLRIRAGVEQQINDRPFALFDCQVEGCLAFKGFPCVNFLASRYQRTYGSCGAKITGQSKRIEY